MKLPPQVILFEQLHLELPHTVHIASNSELQRHQSPLQFQQGLFRELLAEESEVRPTLKVFFQVPRASDEATTSMHLLQANPLHSVDAK